MTGILIEYILEQLTGRDHQDFILINQNFNPRYNKKSKREIKIKQKDFTYLKRCRYSGLNYRDVFFDASEIKNAVRIEIDDNRPLFELADQIEKLDIQPNLTVRTPKGYDLYFLFSTNQEREYLEYFAQAVNGRLNGSEKALLNNLWRVPGSVSYENKFHPFENHVIDIDKITNRHDFNKCAEKIGSITRNLLMEIAFCGGKSNDFSHVPNEFIPLELIEKPIFKDESQNFESKSYYSDEKSERYERIRLVLQEARQDKDLLYSYLGEKSRRQYFNCPYCESANKGKRKGSINYCGDNILFNCFKCGVQGDIITLINKEEGLSWSKLVERVLDLTGNEDLKKSSNFDQVSRDAKGNQARIAQRGLNTLHYITYPPSFSGLDKNGEKTLKKLISVYNSFTDFAKTKLRNQLIFPGSLTEIFNFLGGASLSNSSSSLYFLTAMGWISRLKPKQIPANQLEKTRKHNAKHLNKEVSWWAIPEMTEDLFKLGVQMLIEMKGFGICIKNITRELIRIFLGKDMEDQIFVGVSDRTEWLEREREKTRHEFDDKDQPAPSPEPLGSLSPAAEPVQFAEPWTPGYNLPSTNSIYLVLNDCS